MNRYVSLTLLFFLIFNLSINAKEKPSENNYLPSVTFVKKEIVGGFEVITFHDGEFFERSAFYLANQKESKKLPPEFRPKGIPNSTTFNTIIAKWEDVAISNGKRSLYYGTSGKLAGFANVKDGLYEGDLVITWPSGKIKKKYSFKNGKENGIAYFYNRKGKLLETYTLVNGNIDGEYIKYSENGKSKETKVIKNDRDLLLSTGFFG